jgi:hypothetical protein
VGFLDRRELRRRGLSSGASASGKRSIHQIAGSAGKQKDSWRRHPAPGGEAAMSLRAAGTTFDAPVDHTDGRRGCLCRGPPPAFRVSRSMVLVCISVSLGIFGGSERVRGERGALPRVATTLTSVNVEGKAIEDLSITMQEGTS